MEQKKELQIKQDDKLSKEEIGTLAQFMSEVCIGGQTNELHDMVYNELLPKFTESKELSDDQKTEEVVKMGYRYGLETKIPLWESVDRRYASMATNFSQNLCDEYKCISPSEKAMAQVAANAYTRVMEYSNTLEKFRANENLSEDLSSLCGSISKELDRANRQFISALNMLRQMKMPALRVNIKTNNAFIAKNQQFNQNENIEPK
jgi:hypothetical protein